MRFLGKYELLEQLTVGSVETFVAYPIGGGERLLIHVFALPALIKSGLKNSDLVEYMEAMAPKVLGAVLDAGRYDDGTQAFVVTKFPRDPNALPIWIEAYKSASKKQDTTTVEAPVRQVWGGSTDPQSAPSSDVQAGDFTRAFPGAGPTVKGPKPELATDTFRSPVLAPTHDVMDGGIQTGDPAAQGPLSKFTARLGEGARLPRLAPSFEPAIKTDRAPAPPEPRSSSPWETGTDLRSAEEPTSGAARSGEFTNFFKSPFAAPSPIPESVVEQEPLRSPQPGPAKGDFTQMFGSASPAGGVTVATSEPLLKDASQSGGFTDMFGKVSARVSPPVTPPSEELPGPVEFPDRYSSSQNTNPLPLAKPAAEPLFHSPVVLGSSTPVQGQVDGATRLFRPPVQGTPAPEVPRAESEYTRVVSARAKPAESIEAEPPKQASGGAELPKFSVPVPSPMAMPSVPHPVLAVPAPVPHVPWPAPPPIQVPKVAVVAPAGRKTAKKAGGWTAYVPLIVILNLLLLGAVSLVLYFVLKH